MHDHEFRVLLADVLAYLKEGLVSARARIASDPKTEPTLLLESAEVELLVATLKSNEEHRNLGFDFVVAAEKKGGNLKVEETSQVLTVVLDPAEIGQQPIVDPSANDVVYSPIADMIVSLRDALYYSHQRALSAGTHVPKFFMTRAHLDFAFVIVISQNSEWKFEIRKFFLGGRNTQEAEETRRTHRMRVTFSIVGPYCISSTELLPPE